jgi:alpha/beta superfamily hydrolase
MQRGIYIRRLVGDAPGLSAGTWPSNFRRLRILFFVPLLLIMNAESRGTWSRESDVAVCGSIREPLTFWLWRRLAGAPDPRLVESIKNVERLAFVSGDGTQLGGYKLAAAAPKGYLLVAQGNAMLADHLLADLLSFRELGLDVYIYDYRGYGVSKGKSRLAAIVADYRAIVAHLNGLGYSRQLLYGISMGGVILLNAVGDNLAYMRLVIDSSPARISHLGCPERYDPVAHLPPNSSRLMVISGGADTVVSPRDMDELIRAGQSRGARIFQDKDFAHPFQDASDKVHRRRQNEVAAFLLQE